VIGYKDVEAGHHRVGPPIPVPVRRPELIQVAVCVDGEQQSVLIKLGQAGLGWLVAALDDGEELPV
jgi:hypothetical protein